MVVNTIIMINKLLPTVTIPYSIARGSMQERAQKAERLTDNLYRKTVHATYDGNISLKVVRHILSKVMPPNVKILVMENENTFSEGANDFLFNRNNDIYATTLELRTQNGIFPKEHLVDIFHEGRHIADGLFNPKYYGRFQKLEKRGLLDTKYYKLYDEDLYTRECMEFKSDKKIILKLLERKIKKLLRKHNISDKIDILQNLRYDLESERNAFTSQLKYAKELEKKGMIMTDDRGTDFREEFIFDEKINLIKRIAYDLIKKERGKSAAKRAKIHSSKANLKNKK